MSSTKQKNAQAKEPAQPPVARVRVGLITGSIWERKTENGTFHTVTFERRYRDGETWKSSHSYDAQDLLALAKVADMAHSKIIELSLVDA